MSVNTGGRTVGMERMFGGALWDGRVGVKGREGRRKGGDGCDDGFRSEDRCSAMCHDERGGHGTVRE